jgi:LPXTG-site transpeptidase (sortase) family protein
VPLVDSKYKNKTDFAQWDFNEELENGVVKYPTTPEPGFDGNTLLFWHTSQEWREHNPYGTVFSKIPELEQWDMIKLIRDGKLYEYKIVEKTIVTPKNVNKQYQTYQEKWDDYITIMWCYPLWRTDKRMMVTAKRVK